MEECREDLGAAQATAASWQVQKEQLQAAYTECMAASTSNTGEPARCRAGAAACGAPLAAAPRADGQQPLRGCQPPRSRGPLASQPPA